MFTIEANLDGMTKVSYSIKARLDEVSVGVEWMKLYIALHALHEFLSGQGLAPKYGPAETAVVFPPDQFDRFREICAANAEMAGLFTLPRRKKPNMSLRRTMLGGIALVSSEALLDHYAGAFSPCRSTRPRRSTRSQPDAAVPSDETLEDEIPF
jgi:hypothetical protein